MPAAQLHAQEAQRLQALRAYDILDTPREAEFDEIVEILASVCDAPISVVNLVDNGRQWFKAETGLGVRETPIDSSLCAHAILQKGTMVVPDTTKDSRFSDNPLVTGVPELRFYAGALLESPDGLPLGTLCVLDYRPRTLTPEQERLIGLLAKQVMAQMELRRVLKLEREARAASDKALADNRLLAQEIDHRVKNSLQLVSSLLRMQARRAQDGGVSAQLLEADRRVRSIATVHQQLYQAGSLAGVDVCEFVTSLVKDISETSPAGIEVSSTCDKGRIAPDQAASVGLIVNELMANAFKHAFSEGQAGTVRVSLGVEGEACVVEVADDGAGYGAPVDGKGLGTRIIAGLVERLGGTLERLPNMPGTLVRVRFPSWPGKDEAPSPAR
jgi:two-component sensor histidine kinase